MPAPRKNCKALTRDKISAVSRECLSHYKFIMTFILVRNLMEQKLLAWYLAYLEAELIFLLNMKYREHKRLISKEV